MSVDVHPIASIQNRVSRNANPMEELLAQFARLMETRLAEGAHTTEDSIRYTFFAAVLGATELRPHEIVLELPHPQIPKAEVDTFIPLLYDRPTAIEFKYDRAIPSGGAIPKPQNAGELFKDLHRLSLFDRGPGTRRLLVYCTDRAMTTYFRNPVNRHKEFFDLPKGSRLRIDQAYLSGRPQTFTKMLGVALVVDLEACLVELLPNAHELRVFLVTPVAVDAVVCVQPDELTH
jgi:hypothetical protein